MIVVVGSGSSLVVDAKYLEQFLGERLIHVSRSKPDGVGPENWVETKYDPSDGSIKEVSSLRDITTLVWLASPSHQALFAMQEDSEIHSSLVQGIVFQSLLVRSILPQMVASRHGRFVFAGSSRAKSGFAGSLLYMQVKGAQSALSKGLAIEYGALGITSNVINLGLLDGGMASNLPPGVAQEMLERTSSGKRVPTENFWKLVKLVSTTPAINGAEIALDGGYH
jgi:3-oxoacyl-[acyl-carrier protein] reductase